MREELAAEYVGLSASTFRTEVAAGRAPAAVWLTAGRKIWLRDALDHWLDAKAGVANDHHPTMSPHEALVNEWDMACDGTAKPTLS